MRTQTTIKGLFALAALAVSLVGCGGLGDTSDEPNFYRGGWIGEWSSAPLGESGAIALEIAPDGTLTGTMTITEMEQNGDIVGKVEDDGSFTAEVTFEEEVGVYELDGNIAREQGGLSGHYTTSTSGNTYSSLFFVEPSVGDGD